MSEVLLETAVFTLERSTAGYIPIENARWTLTVKTPDGKVVLSKDGLKRLTEVLVAERSRIVP